MLIKVRTLRTIVESSPVLIVRLPDAEPVERVAHAGPSFLASPQLNPEMIRVANRYQVAAISGAFTPTELPESAGAGADAIKLFPTDNSLPDAKAVLAPLAHRPTMPAGVSVSPTCVRGSRRVPRRSAWRAPSRRNGSPTATSPESLLPKASSRPFRTHARDVTSSPPRCRRVRNPVRSPGAPGILQQRLRYRAWAERGRRLRFHWACSCLGHGVNELTTS
jgi:hypothetical protein